MSLITVELALYTYKQNTLDDNVYFFYNLFWFSFYFRLFDPNWKPINLNFLVNDEIEKIKIKIKKALNMGGVPNFLGKIHFSSWTFNINYTITVSRYFFNLSLVIFIIFLVPSWERKGRSPDSSGRKRKLSFTFFFMMEVHIRCVSLPLNFVKKHIWVRVDF